MPVSLLSEPPLVADVDSVRGCIQSFPKGTSCGRDGLRAQHILDAFCGEGSAVAVGVLKAISVVVNLLLGGRCPKVLAEFVASAPLTPLLKPDNGIRPIAVGAFWRRLVSKVAMRGVRKEMSKYLCDFQFGVGVSRGAEAVLHSANRFLNEFHSDGSLAMLTVDFSNAFNLVDRTTLLHEVRTRCPSISLWVDFLYGQSARLYVGDDLMWSTTGVQQGDPLGPLLFALVLHPLVHRIRDCCKLLFHAWYLDDGTIIGDTKEVAKALDIIRAEGPRLGLELNIKKTEVFWPSCNGVKVQDGLFPHGIGRPSLGVKLLGGAVSKDAGFISSLAVKRASRAVELMSHLPSLRDPQSELLLLRSCMGVAKLLFGLRTCQPMYIGEAVSIFDNGLRRAIEDIVVCGGPFFGDFQWRLASLPTRFGGLGLCSAEDVSTYAFVASRAQSWSLQDHILQGCVIDGVDSDYGYAMDRLRMSLPDFDLSGFSNKDTAPPKAQNVLACALFSEIVKSLGVKFDLSPRQKAVFECLRAPHAQNFLTVTPIEGLGQHMSALEYRTILKYRLMIPLFPADEPCPVCRKVCLDSFGEHAVHCKELPGFKYRHDLVRDVLYDVLKRAGISSKKEAPVNFLTDPLEGRSTLRPADILVFGWAGAKHACVDLTGVSPLVGLRDNGFVAGEAALKAESSKVAKHEKACFENQHVFIPFAFDTFGFLAPEAEKFLSRVQRVVQSLHSIDQSSNTPRIVGIYMVPSVEYIISVLSVLRCGEAFMPLDPSWPKERVLSVVASSAPSLILCGSTLFDGNCSDEIDKDHWLIDSGGCPVFVVSMKTILNENLASPSLLWPCGNKRARPFCYLMYTSGSTGTPKGVCGTEQGLLNRFLWMQDMYPLCGEESLLFKTSVGFIDHLQEILGALLTGCTLVIPSFSVLKENILSIPEYLQDYSINRLVAVPSLMRILLPTLQSSYNTTIQDSLKLLILSGEILHLSLWNSLTKLLPDTAILNLYGSTEVSGDCTYFDCKKLSAILESEAISTVPIGMPIPNCEVMLIGEDTSNCGEIYVSGSCTASGYFSHEIMPFKSVKNLPESSFCCSVDERESQLFFKTGDFAKQLPSGDLVYIGRNDRTVKVNGNRIALEEIEYTIRTHEDVLDAAVILNNAEGEVAYLEAFIVSKLGHDCVKGLSSSFRGWIVDKLPLAMIPKRLFFVETIPMSSSGKVDYKSLVDVTCSTSDVCSEIEEVPDGHFLQTIKEAFCDALVVEKISNNDDFFAMGGDSISAAHTSHKLGINMKLLYTFPTPLKLAMAFLDPKISRVDKEVLGWGPQHPNGSKGTDLEIIKPRGRLSGKLGEPDAEYHPKKVFKLDADLNIDDTSFAISRCNKVMFGDHYDISKSLQTTWFSDKKASIRKLWKVHMESCVDASPLVVVRGKDMFVYIGSHSHKFICINAQSGFVQWEVQLEGRVECSAAILGDFSEVVVGCYKGNIYFLNSSSGSISWTFQTGGEVKSQPVVDKQRHLVWCGSYDHNLYALDYQSYCCVYKLDCGGSIYGSPAINEVDERLYFPSTNGSMTALSLKANPFSMLWRQDMGAPIFGSLLIDRKNGNVICCLVNGHVVAVDAVGSIVWRAITGGPIFAGPCLSHVLNRQVIICSRDGGVYSFGLEKGNLLWKHDLGDPISSSAYVDENMQLTSNHSIVPDRLICVCTSSGIITLLRISLENVKETTPVEKHVVHEFARLDIQGAIFSSPVMIGGRIFVGCRDEYVHCHEIG